jgi:hypothetical protein
MQSAMAATAEALLRDWSPFSSPASFSTGTYGADTDAAYDADMEIDDDDDASSTTDPGVSETVFDWTDYITVVPMVNSHFPGIVSSIDIPPGVYLGDIEGERKYIWEIPEESQDKIIWIFEDCVLDCSNNGHRNVLSYAREGFYSGFKVNCKLRMMTDADGETHVGLETIETVHSGEELVYWHPEMV